MSGAWSLSQALPPVQIRIYNLAKQAMVKKLFTGAGVITSIALHSTGWWDGWA